MKLFGFARCSIVMTLSLTALSAIAAPITPGNLVVLQSGVDATTGGNAAAITLLEYTTGGSLVQTLSVPSDAVTGLTLRGSSTSEGILSLSGNGNFITFGGHRVAAGSANPNNVNTSGARGVARVSVSDFSLAGLVTTTLPAVVYSGDSLRSAVTNDGNQYWTTGAGSSTTNGGLQYFDGTTVTSLNAGNNNTRQVQIIGGNLYLSAASNTPARALFKSSPALPTSGTPTLTQFTPAETTKQYQNFVLANLNPSIGYDGTAFDTAYATDSNAPGALTKFTFDGTSWSLSATTIALSGAAGLTGVSTANGFQLYATQSATSTGAIQQFLDTSGYNGVMSGSFAGLSSPVTTATNTGLRGIVLVPVPEPATLVLAGLGLVGILLGARRKLLA